MGITKTIEPFVCGGTAASFASCVIHPIDLAKVRMQLYGQMNPGKPIPSFPTLLKNMIAKDGIMSIYMGVDAAVTRQLSYGTARLGLHRTFSDMLQKANGGEPISFAQKTLSGMGSGAIAVCIGTPVDVALVRLQADSMAEKANRKNYKNVVDTFVRVTTEEGVGALYKGMVPNILRGMAMNVGMLACYDQAKEVSGAALGDPFEGGQPRLTTKLASSAIAGFTAALFSIPFDLMKSRLMNMRKDPITGKMPYTGIVDCARQILTKEGPQGFFNGFSAYYGRCAPHAMIILLSTEYITEAYRKFMY